ETVVQTWAVPPMQPEIALNPVLDMPGHARFRATQPRAFPPKIPCPHIAVPSGEMPVTSVMVQPVRFRPRPCRWVAMSCVPVAGVHANPVSPAALSATWPTTSFPSPLMPRGRRAEQPLGVTGRTFVYGWVNCDHSAPISAPLEVMYRPVKNAPLLLIASPMD